MPDPVVSSADPELRAHVERVLAANYEVDQEIGRGGMGIVYKARDRRLKRSIAIKVLPPELAFRSEIRTRFLREAETAAQLSHPNIVPIYTVDERDGIVYFVMAFVDGENVAVRLHRHGALGADESRRILLEVTRALAYAHDRGVIHRDIKPDNILLQKEDGRAMVTDFGIARAVTEGADSRLTATGMAIGTPAYMSPEQSTGDRLIDGRSDLYSLGVVGYQMLTGEPPFEALSTPAMLVKHLSERPEPIESRRPDVPPDLGRAVMLLLEKDPANRFPSAGALAVALETGDVPPLPAIPERADSLMGSATRHPRRDAVGDHADTYQPTADELSRWNDPKVIAFRRRLGPYVIVNSVIIVMSIFTGFDLVMITAIWSVFLAFKYAKLWTDGNDWRDVLKEPRDRMFFDVVAEWVDNFRAIWDKNKRAEVRARGQARGRAGAGMYDRPTGRPAPTGSRLAAAELTTITGPYAAAVRKAAVHRDEILRMVEKLPARDRTVVAEVPATAVALYRRVEALAINLAELDRSVAPDAASSVEAEISALEAQANPLDIRASEERVRRLAYLKRQRRAVADVVRRRTESRDKLESCQLALENMSLDVLRLKAGGQSLQQITLVAEKAMALAQEVDNAVYVADEMAKLGRGSGAGGRAPRP